MTARLDVCEVDADVLMFRGGSYQSVATAFIHDEDVVLVDCLADLNEARLMRDRLDSLGTVRLIILTHLHADHYAGIRLFPQARVLAHRNFSFTLHATRASAEIGIDANVVPTRVIDEAIRVVHGRHELRVFHNPGKTMCSLGIDVPSSDLLFTADNLLGNIVYLSGSSPDLLHLAMNRLESVPRNRLVEGHQGIFPRSTIEIAREYLVKLEQLVRDARCAGIGFSIVPDAEFARAIPIEACLRPGIEPSDFERQWHEQNLLRIAERYLFAAPSPAGLGVNGATVDARTLAPV